MLKSTLSRMIRPPDGVNIAMNPSHYQVRKRGPIRVYFRKPATFLLKLLYESFLVGLRYQLRHSTALASKLNLNRMPLGGCLHANQGAHMSTILEGTCVLLETKRVQS